MVEKNRGEQIVESLLQKPSKKPDFAAEIKNLLPHRVGKLQNNMLGGQIQQDSALNRVKTFLPDFIANTDRILSDPTLKASHQMNIQIRDQASQQLENDEEVNAQENMATDKLDSNSKVISMEIGVGVYDVLNKAEEVDKFQDMPSFDKMGTEQILKINKPSIIEQKIGDENSSSDDDSDNYMEFDSSDEEADQNSVGIESLSTANLKKNSKGTSGPVMSQKGPLIQEIESKEFISEDSMQEMSAELGKRKRPQ